MAPSAPPPAPTMVCSSSMKVITSPSASVISFSTAFSRSSNSPRYLAPATMADTSSPMTRLPFRPSGTSPFHDALGQALDDGRLAHAGLADEDRVVLRPTGQHLDDPADLLVPADDRVHLPLTGQLGEVAAVLLEGLEGVLGVLGGDPVAAADVPQGGEEVVPRHPQPVGHGQKEVLDRQVVVPHVGPEAVGRGRRVAHGRVETRLLTAVGLGQPGQLAVEAVAQRRRLDPDPGQDGAGRGRRTGRAWRPGCGRGSPRRGARSGPVPGRRPAPLASSTSIGQD